MHRTTMSKSFLPNCAKIRLIYFYHNIKTLQSYKKNDKLQLFSFFYKHSTKYYNLMLSQTQETQKNKS